MSLYRGSVHTIARSARDGIAPVRSQAGRPGPLRNWRRTTRLHPIAPVRSQAGRPGPLRNWRRTTRLHPIAPVRSQASFADTTSRVGRVRQPPETVQPFPRQVSPTRRREWAEFASRPRRFSHSLAKFRRHDVARFSKAPGRPGQCTAKWHSRIHRACAIQQGSRSTRAMHGEMALPHSPSMRHSARLPVDPPDRSMNVPDGRTGARRHGVPTRCPA